jgi:hypothetical protein
MQKFIKFLNIQNIIRESFAPDKFGGYARETPTELSM